MGIILVWRHAVNILSVDSGRRIVGRIFWMTLVAALAGVSTQASAQVPLHDSRYEMVTTQLDQNISFGQNISAWRIGLDRPLNPGTRAALTLAHSVNLTNRGFVICHWRSICTIVRRMS